MGSREEMLDRTAEAMKTRATRVGAQGDHSGGTGEQAPLGAAVRV